MRQYRQFKEQHPECVLFFRMGDFYELFYDDARLAAKVLGLTLTQRTEGIPMAGVPYHSVEGYLRRMLQAGHRVAICEQMEDPSQAKGIVRRDVTRLVTPGTLTDDHLLDEAKDNCVAAIAFTDDDSAGIAAADLSTGRFTVASLRGGAIADELARLAPSELLHVETANRQPPPRVQQIARAIGAALTPRPAWHFRQAEAHEALRTQFQVATLAGFGFDDDEPLLAPAGAVVRYLIETQRCENGRLTHLQPPRRYDPADHMLIDHVSLRSLEVERTMRSGEVAGSLVGTLQDCHTAMGKRLLRQWLCYPLADRQRIEARQQAVAALLSDEALAEKLAEQINGVQDVPRIASRIAVGRPAPRDLVALGQSLARSTRMVELLRDCPALSEAHDRLSMVVDPLQSLASMLSTACVEQPPAHLREGGLIRDGYDRRLDEYRSLQRDSTQWLADYQKQMIEQTGIHSLKIGYNKVFGYYLEVTHAHRSRVPDNFTRKQTLKNAERYITDQLKQYEDKVLGAGQKAVSREQELFAELCAAAAERIDALHTYAEVVAELDVLGCFARRARRRGYIQPEIVDEPALHIVEGRHPVLEQILADRFVPNDVELHSRDTRATLALITGPNMAGKSTYIRQTALLVLLAHTGSFIPAREARIGLCDRIFTRIGASDELHAGQSTFMVEMVETANIAHHATQRSLVILDEIGRGTSTLDGLALAWAITEHLAERNCRTLFATHYHELTQLAAQFDNIVNLNVTVREWADEVVFLHRITPGATDRSYGIHVAKIAGLPPAVVKRAQEVMGQLAVHTGTTSALIKPQPRTDRVDREEGQLGLFTEFVEHPAVERLRSTDLNALSPLQAFDLLRQVKRELDGHDADSVDN
jgi:DNA mismatch repair protein MutS